MLSKGKRLYKSAIIEDLPNYAFAEVDNLVNKLKNQGIEPIDFGVGDPSEATPKFIRDACKKALEIDPGLVNV